MSAVAATPGTDRMLAGWGRTSPSRARLHAPLERGELVALVRAAGARGVLARGLGRSYGDAAQNAGGDVICTTALDGIEWVDRDDGVVRAESGTSIAALLEEVVPRGWFLPVTPGTRFVTIGGAVAADVHGKNHLTAGSFGRHLRSLELLDAEGELHEVRPGDDAFRAAVGGMGLTGTVVAATIALAPIETGAMRRDTDSVADLDAALALMCDERRQTVAWIDASARGTSLGRAIVTSGGHALRADSDAPLRPPGRPVGSVPPRVPGGLFTEHSVRAANAFRFHRAPRSERGALEPIAAFYYPLDAVRDWNRLYGPQGLLQYQFAVPSGAEHVLHSVLALFQAARCPSPLVVLKRLGEGTGLLSFPIAGWTLALDFPVSNPGLAAALDRADEVVAAAGGRVYLAKDGRLRPELLAAMYPELDTWRVLRERLDPGGRFNSDLGRRLALTG